MGVDRARTKIPSWRWAEHEGGGAGVPTGVVFCAGEETEGFRNSTNGTRNPNSHRWMMTSS